MQPVFPLADVVVLVDLIPKDQAEPGRASAMIVLLAFLVSFGFIRTSARLMRSPKVPWWPGSVTTESGLHIHHMVWGIWLMLICGFAAFATDLDSPWWWITSIGFGVGAGLTLDEFALWLHLDDVYWSDDGRASIDAVIFAALGAGLVVVGFHPFGLNDAGSISGTAIVGTINIVTAAIVLLKGRLVWGALAVFIPIVGLVFIFRLAKPHSPWARWFYLKRRPDKMERSRQRFASDARSERFGRRLQDAIGGRPTDELLADEAKKGEGAAALGAAGSGAAAVAPTAATADLGAVGPEAAAVEPEPESDPELDADEPAGTAPTPTA